MTNDKNILLIGHGDIIEESLFFFFSRKYARVVSSHREKMDLLSPAAVEAVFKKDHFDQVVLGSLRSGGIGANRKFPAEFCRENMLSTALVVDAAYRAGVEKLLFLSSSCIYPKDCAQPIKEESLMTGPMEPTSEAYAMAKLAGVKLCQAYRRQFGFKAITAIPATVYGPGMDVDEDNAHVLGALLNRFFAAKHSGQDTVTLWGSGAPRREFLFGEDLARACEFLLADYDGEQIVHIGTGEDISIRELAELMAEVVGYSGKIEFDPSHPDGAMKKLLDSGFIRGLGWKPEMSLPAGVERACQWYREADRKKS